MKKQPFKSHISAQPNIPLFTTALMAAGLLTQTASFAQVQSAEELFVRVDATALPEGPLQTIPNSGTLGGVFEARGGGDMVPTVVTIGGTKAIRFDGNDFLQLADAAGGSLIIPPAGLVGEDPSRSIEVWALNPAVVGEETLVSWGKRGGPDGSNISFNYGSDFRWGALGHWGSPDLGWNNNGGNPPANQWHHLVYTLEPNATTGQTTSRVYVDGALANGEIFAAGVFNTHPDTSIQIGAQLEADGTTVTGGLRFDGAIARVRIHNGVLTPQQIANNYNTEKSAFIDPAPVVTPPVQAERLAGGPTHRYSFGETAAANAEGLEFKDSVGTAHGVVVGPGAEYTGARLRLPGGSSAEAPYGDLPNGLLSQNSTNNTGTGEFSFETWVKITGSRTWSRIFDFGSSNGEEVTGPGGGGNGTDYLEFSAQIGDDTNNRRLELRNEDPAGGGIVTADSGTRTFNTDTHLVVSWNERTGAVNLYENGTRISGLTTDDAMSEINDVNVWLGRSNWTADQNTQGEYDEVRFYNSVLTPGEVLGNFLAGPNNLNDHDFPVTIVTQPQDASALANGSVTFSAVAQGSSPVSFQWLKNGTPIPGATNRTLSISNVSASDTGATFSVQASNTVSGSPVNVTSSPARLTVVSDTVTLKHRYSFNETSGTQVTDSVGAANGEVLGAGAFGAGNLTLDGSDGTYVNLPNGLITALGTNATFEMWVTYAGGPNWTRVFDFGTSTGGEDISDGGAEVDGLFFTSKSGDGIPRFEANFPGGGVTTTAVHPGGMPVGEEEHLVITYSFTGNSARIYTNGTLVATAPGAVSRPLSAMNNRDVNNWLGRSQFADPFWAGKYNEFRIYQGAMTPEQVAASFAAGPNSLPTPGTRPELSAQRSGNNLVVSWPDSQQGFVLEGAATLGAGATWTTIGDGTPATAGKFQVTVPIDQSRRFLRLKR
jgi:hypothetical protein